ncbi:MAG: polysaccharide biosynthesis/export family protein, partial [Sphingomonadales bacterium]
MRILSWQPLFALLFTALLALPSTEAAAQVPDTRNNPGVMAQIYSALSAKGLTQDEVKERLKSKGLNVDTMSDVEIAQNRSVIEQTVAELEAEKKKTKSENKSAPGTPIVADPSGSAKVSEQSSTAKEPVTTKAEAVADAMQKAVVQVAPEVGIYGHDIFTNQTLDAFRTTDGARAPDTYILGAGDRIRITIFGMSQADLLLEINKEGYIQPTGLKQLYLQGVSLEEARKLIGQRFSAAYRFQQDQYAVTLQTARAITVNVFGETNLRGSFNMSALNTAFNALAVAGGPAMQGSVRAIELIRGKNRKKIDVYAFLSNPATQFDFDIQQNDILYVPMAQRVVTLEGAVKRPMKYELTGKEGLQELFGFAGGINYNTYVEFVQVERNQADSVVLLEYKLSDILNGTQSAILLDGDIVRVRENTRPLERFTEVEGAVYYPGRYELQKDMRLGALITKVQLMPEAKNDFFFVERLQRDSTVKISKVTAADASNFVLEPRDRVQVFNKSLYANQDLLEVVGSVRAPVLRAIPFGEQVPLADVVELAGGLLPTALEQAQVMRRDVMSPGKVEYYAVDLLKPAGFKLQAGDKLIVYDKRTFVLGSSVSIAGSVKDTLTTLYSPTLTIPELIKMAGGFTRSATSARLDVFRLGYGENGSGFTRFELEVDSSYNVIAPTTSFTLMPFDKVVVRDLPMFNLDRTVMLKGQVKYPGVYALEAKQVHLSDVLEQAGGLNSLADRRHALLIRSYNKRGLIGINLQKALQRRGSLRFDPVLLPGDTISIPAYQNTVGVRVQGTRQADLILAGIRTDSLRLNSVSSYIYANSRNAGWYIKEYAGGFAKRADKKSVTVAYPDGSVRGTRTVFLFFRKYPTVRPGTLISLTNKEEVVKGGGEKKVDWDNVISKIMAAATTLAVLI